MAWIESHQTLARHPKTKRLARTLGISLVQAIGHLHCFWWWALDFAQDGVLVGMEPEDIAEGAMWEGDAVAFIEALILTGFVDRPDAEQADQLSIHDWWEYAGKLMDRRAANAERQKRWRERTQIPVHAPQEATTITSRNASRNTHVTPHIPVTCEATVPNRTKPNQPLVEDLQPKIVGQNPQDGHNSKTLFQDTSEQFHLAALLRERILQRNPKAKMPALDSKAFQAWCYHIDLLLRIDKRDKEEVLFVIEWCQRDEFWHQNILSTRTLRDKFDQLFLRWQSKTQAQLRPIRSQPYTTPLATGPPPITLEEALAQGIKP